MRKIKNATKNEKHKYDYRLRQGLLIAYIFLGEVRGKLSSLELGVACLGEF